MGRAAAVPVLLRLRRASSPTAVREGRREEFAQFAAFRDAGEPRAHSRSAGRSDLPGAPSSTGRTPSRCRMPEWLAWYRRLLACAAQEIVPLTAPRIRSAVAAWRQCIGDECGRRDWSTPGGDRLRLPTQPVATLASRAARRPRAGTFWHGGRGAVDGASWPWPDALALTDRSSAELPRATYRLQFTKDFGFDDAAAIAPYLARLGVSHVYASPYLKARPGSTHGYDIVDHDAAQPGARRRRRTSHRMVDGVPRHGLGQILDFVPNHMGVGGADNPLVAGRARMGPAFALRRLVRHRLGPDRALPAGQAAGAVPRRPVRRGAGGRQARRCGSTRRTGSLRGLGLRHPQAADLPAALRRDPRRAHPRWSAAATPSARMRNGGRRRARARAGAEGRARGAARRATPEVARAHRRRGSRASTAARATGELATARCADPAPALAGRRISAWPPTTSTTAASSTSTNSPGCAWSCRRCSTTRTAGVRPARDGVLDGLRIDHIDGLLDPKAVLLQRLREQRADAGLLPRRREDPGARTRRCARTGRSRARPATNSATSSPGCSSTPPARRRSRASTRTSPASRRAVRARSCATASGGSCDNEMASELNVLAREAAALARISRAPPTSRDNLSAALREIVACFPVYRTYVDAHAARRGRPARHRLGAWRRRGAAPPDDRPERVRFPRTGC